MHDVSRMRLYTFLCKNRDTKTIAREECLDLPAGNMRDINLDGNFFPGAPLLPGDSSRSEATAWCALCWPANGYSPCNHLTMTASFRVPRVSSTILGAELCKVSALNRVLT